MKRLAICLAALCLICAAAAAHTQSSNSQSPSSSSSTSPSQPKPKKVYTEEDLSLMSGGISVVGEATKVPAKKKPAADAKNPEKTEPAESGNAEEEDAAASNRPKCESLAWGMAVDTVLRQQGVRMDRSLWVQKAYGGDICTATLGSVDNLARSLSGDYALDDGSKIRINANLFPGLPSAAAFVESVKAGKPWILILGGHPWLIETLNVINYDNGADYDIREIKLADPYYGRRSNFIVGKRDPKEIEAVVEVTVAKR